jgi:hypothetical protein
MPSSFFFVLLVVSFLIIIDGAFPPALSRSLPHSQKFAVAQPTHEIISSHQSFSNRSKFLIAMGSFFFPARNI